MTVADSGRISGHQETYVRWRQRRCRDQRRSERGQDRQDFSKVAIAMTEQGDSPDVVCEHGTAMDVHCCHCHTGFIFDTNHECPDPTPSALKELLSASDDLLAVVKELREQVADWQRWSIVEIAVRNPNVASYINHWEGRTLAAEATLATLREGQDKLLQWRADVTSAAISAAKLEGGLLYDDVVKAIRQLGTDREAAERRVQELEQELQAEHETSRNDPCEQRAERYAMEAFALGERVRALEAALMVARPFVVSGPELEAINDALRQETR